MTPYDIGVLMKHDDQPDEWDDRQTESKKNGQQDLEALYIKLQQHGLQHSTGCVFDPQCGLGGKCGENWGALGVEPNRPHPGNPLVIPFTFEQFAEVFEQYYPSAVINIMVAQPPVALTDVTHAFGLKHCNMAIIDYVTQVEGEPRRELLLPPVFIELRRFNYIMGNSNITHNGKKVTGGQSLWWVNPVRRNVEADLERIWKEITAIITERGQPKPEQNITFDDLQRLVVHVGTEDMVRANLGRPDIELLRQANGRTIDWLMATKETRKIVETIIIDPRITMSQQVADALLEYRKNASSLTRPILPLTDLSAFGTAAISDEYFAKAEPFSHEIVRRRSNWEWRKGYYRENHKCVLSGYRTVISGNARDYSVETGGPPMTAGKLIGHCKGDDQFSFNTWKLLEFAGSRFTYYPGQLDFIAAVACKDTALIAAETGCGKTLMAISLMRLKPHLRCLIIAPQGTVRSEFSNGDDEVDIDGAPQWIAEIAKFAPHKKVWRLFSPEDAERMEHLNWPSGVYVTYYQAMFTNEKRVFPDATRPNELFGMVIADEFHIAKSINSQTGNELIKLQPQFAYGLTATPITNRVDDLFMLMGWLAVPRWFEGGRRNARWPFALEDYELFCQRFLCEERDFTEEAKRSWSGYKARVKRVSAVLSQPDILAAHLAPTVAYITKPKCNPNYTPPNIQKILVPFGLQQMNLYRSLCDRNIFKDDSPMVAARKQIAVLRTCCAAPANLATTSLMTYARGCRSNFNPKSKWVLDKIIALVSSKQQVLVVSARIAQTSYYAGVMEAMNIPYGRIDATIDPKKHAGIAADFKAGKFQVLFMGIKCAAAYSFQQCKHMIVGSLEYSWGIFSQAIGRIDRVTCEQPANIYCLLHEHSIEEIMWENVIQKGDTANMLLRGEVMPLNHTAVAPLDLMVDAIAKLSEVKGVCEDMLLERWEEEKGIKI